jgi:hypothetical protein
MPRPGGGSLGHSKHRKACIHGRPGEGSKGKYGPVSERQKFHRRLEANAPKKKRLRSEMKDSIRELFSC